MSPLDRHFVAPPTMSIDLKFDGSGNSNQFWGVLEQYFEFNNVNGQPKSKLFGKQFVGKI